MADTPLYTNEAALAEASVNRLSLADATAVPPNTYVVRLFDGTLVPTPTTTQAQLVAAETTLVGYPAGGYPVTANGPLFFLPGGGVGFQSPIINVVYASGAAVTIGGYWVEDLAGDVRQVFIYDPQRNLAAVGDGWPLVAQWGFGRNA